MKKLICFILFTLGIANGCAMDMTCSVDHAFKDASRVCQATFRKVDNNAQKRSLAIFKSEPKYARAEIHDPAYLVYAKIRDFDDEARFSSNLVILGVSFFVSACMFCVILNTTMFNDASIIDVVSSANKIIKPG